VNLQERIKILVDLDVVAARAALEPQESAVLSNEGILAGMHKCRISIRSIDVELRRQSLRWLRLHGYAGVDGAPLPREIKE